MTKKFSIVVKAVVVTGLFLAVALSATGVWLFHSQRQFAEGVKDRQRIDSMTALETLRQTERTTLDRNVGFVSQLIAGIAEQYIYDVNREGLTPVLRSFMGYPELLAIDVNESDGSPFAAVWRDGSELRFDADLPSNVVGSERPLNKVEVKHGDEIIGIIQVYYSDEFLVRKAQFLEIAQLETLDRYAVNVDAELKSARRRQNFGFTVVTIVLVMALGLLLRALVRLPLEKIMGEMEGIGADLTRRVSEDGGREIVRIAEQFNIFVGQLSDMLAIIDGSSRQMEHTSHQIASLSAEIAQVSQHERDRSAAVVEVNKQVQHVAHNVHDLAEQAVHRANFTENQARNSIQLVDRTINAIV